MWNPGVETLREDEVEAAVGTLGQNRATPMPDNLAELDTVTPGPAERILLSRRDDLVNAEQYAEQKDKDKQGECNFCGYPTTRPFCGGKCETKAAFATMGKSLKFHE